MARKIADVRLFWTPSPSPGIVSRKVEVTVNGTLASSVQVGPEVSETQVTVEANSVVTVRTVVEDDEGQTAASVEYTFRLGDFEVPLPDSGLGHEVVAIRDVEDPPPVE